MSPSGRGAETGAAGRETSGWLVYPRPSRSATMRLICLPFAGGGASIFRMWPAGLPPAVEVVAVQLPGRESRQLEAPFTRLGPLIDGLAAVLEPLVADPDRPYALFGHSMGGLLAYALAREFERRSLPLPVHLIVSARRAPGLPVDHPVLHNLPDEEFLAELGRLDGAPSAAMGDPELRRLVLPTLRADFAVCETYVHEPAPPLACPITAYGGLRDRTVSYRHLEAWRTETGGEFLVRMFPGGHFFLETDEALVLQALTRDLGRFQGKSRALGRARESYQEGAR